MPRRAAPRRGDLSRFEGRDGGNRGRFSGTYLPRRKRSTGRAFQPDRMRSIATCLSSSFFSIFVPLTQCSRRLSRLSVFPLRLLFSLLYYHGFYCTVCFSLSLPCQRNHRDRITCSLTSLPRLLIRRILSREISRVIRVGLLARARARVSSKDVTLVDEAPGSRRKKTTR